MLTPADRTATRLLSTALDGPLPPPLDDREEHRRRTLRWLDLLKPTDGGGDELPPRARRRLEALADLILEDLGQAIRQTTTRADGGPAAQEGGR